MRGRRRPTARIGLDDRQHDAIRRLKAQIGDGGRVGLVVVEVVFLNGREVFEIALQRRGERLAFRVLELRNGDRRQNANDHHNDEQLDEGEASRLA